MTKSRWLISAIVFAITMGTVASAHAGVLNYLGRMFGAGWSDGYHADDWRYQNRGHGMYPTMESVPMGYPMPYSANQGLRSAAPTPTGQFLGPTPATLPRPQ